MEEHENKRKRNEQEEPSPEEKARRAKSRELLQAANVNSMKGIQNLYKETIVEFMENGLEADREDELLP